MMVNSVFLYPLEGALDVASIEQFLAQQPDVLLDPLGTGTYLVCGLPEAKDVFRDERVANPSGFPYVVLVTVSPERMNVYQEWGDADRLRSARNIVRWTVEHSRCRIEDEYYNGSSRVRVMGDCWADSAPGRHVPTTLSKGELAALGACGAT